MANSIPGLEISGVKTRRGYLIPNPKIRYKLGLFLLVLCDLLILVGIFALSFGIRKNLVPLVLQGSPPFNHDIAAYYWILPLWMALLAYNGGYSRRLTFWDEVHFLWKSTIFASIAMFSVFFVGKIGTNFSRIFILLMSALGMVLFPLLRTYAKRALYSLDLLKRKMLILGAGEAGLKCLSILKRERNLGYEVAGFIEETPIFAGPRKKIDGIKVHGFLEKADRYIKRCSIHDVLIAYPELEKDRLSSIINRVQQKAENTLLLPDLAGVAVMGTQMRHFFREHSLLIEFKNNLARPMNYYMKRALDYLLGSAIFFLLIGPILFIALLIRLSSPGRAVFSHERIGKGGRPFRCYKFRTMYRDAAEKLDEILEKDPSARDEWRKYSKLRDDPRVTPLGRFLRRTSLDELPQIFNIFKGEMSLIGPRPLVEREWNSMSRYKEVVLSVPPGITGLWQVSGRNGNTLEERMTLDCWYIRNWSLWLDLVILFKTVYVVFKGEGAS